MALGILKKPNPDELAQRQAEEEAQRQQEEQADNTAFGQMAKSAGARTVFEQDELLMFATDPTAGIEALGLIKELGMSNLRTPQDQEEAQALFDLLQCAIADFPEEGMFIKRCYARFIGFLMLRCSNLGWARELMKTSRLELHRKGQEETKKPPERKGF